MALIFTDGCDSYSAVGDILNKWSRNSVSSDLALQVSSGRFGGGAIEITDDATGSTLPLQLTFPKVSDDVDNDDLYLSFSMRVQNSIPTNETLVQFLNASATVVANVELKTTGAVELNGASGASLGTSGGGLIQVDMWQWIEIRVRSRNSPNGQVQVRIDGNSEMNVTGDTLPSSEAGIVALHIGGFNTGAGATILIDDVIVHKDSGGGLTGFQGDTRIATLRPDGAGDSSDSTANGAASRHEAVDEASFDGDTSYVAMDLANDEDLYTCGNLPVGVGSAVRAVAVNVLARADAGSVRTMRAKVKSSTTEGNGTTENVAQSSNYRAIQGFFHHNPHTTAAWSTGEVDAMQIGQEVIF